MRVRSKNRARILFEVVEAVLEEVDPSRVGVKIGPMHDGGPMAANDETLPITEYAVRKLDGYGLSHLLLDGQHHRLHWHSSRAADGRRHVPPLPTHFSRHADRQRRQWPPNAAIV